MSGSTTTIWSLITAFGLPTAIVAFIFSRWRERAQEQRAARLAYLNDQLERLYGPLFALTQANHTAWNSFCDRYAIDGAVFEEDQITFDQQQLEAWVLWVRAVFHPINLKIRAAIVENAHLIDGPEMPTSFIEFLAHVETYTAVIESWDESTVPRALNGELSLSDLTSINTYPDEFDADVAAAFSRLKKRQAEIIAQSFHDGGAADNKE